MNVPSTIIISIFCLISALVLSLFISTNTVYDIRRFGIDLVAPPRHAGALIVIGPVSLLMELAFKKIWNAAPQLPAGGDRSVDGTPEGSHSVTNGVGNVIPVDCFIQDPERIVSSKGEFQR